MANLPKLPPELILEICQHIHDHDLDKPNIEQDWDLPQKTLLSLCKVSKAFFGIAHPILFRRVHARLEERGAISPKFIKLVEILNERPYHAQQLRMLKLSISIQSLEEQTQLATRDHIYMTVVARKLSWMSDLQSTWHESIPARNHVMMGLLLAMVPSVEHLQFAVPDSYWSGKVLSHDVQLAVSQKKILTQLKALDVHTTSDFRYSALNLDNQVYFALIQPQLTRFHCRGYQGFASNSGWSQLTHIKNLALYDCNMTARELGEITATCQSLQIVAFTALPMAARDTWNRQKDTPKEYSAELQKHSQTLKELHLEVNFRKDTLIWDGGISSFETFTSLKSLKMSPLDFAETFVVPSTLGSHGFSATLPSTLKHLTIARWCWPIRIDIDWLSQAAYRGELDNLESLDIEYCLSATKDRLAMENDLRERLEKDTGGPITFSIRVRKVEDRYKGRVYSGYLEDG